MKHHVGQDKDSMKRLGEKYLYPFCVGKCPRKIVCNALGDKPKSWVKAVFPEK